MRTAEISRMLHKGGMPGNHFRIYFHSEQNPHFRYQDPFVIDFEPFDHFDIDWGFLKDATVEVLAEEGKGVDRMKQCEEAILAAEPKWSVWCIPAASLAWRVGNVG